METIYLGSASPRRFELICRMGLPCEVLKFEAEEPMNQDLSPADLATDLSERKMTACLARFGSIEDGWVVTADTLIALDDEKIGKPSDREDARRMISRLQGRAHQVYTGLSLRRPTDGTILTVHDRTDVMFSPMDSREIDFYLNTGEWEGVAGGYRIQEKGGMFVSSLNGSYFNVMGLPINILYGMLRQLKYSI